MKREIALSELEQEMYREILSSYRAIQKAVSKSRLFPSKRERYLFAKDNYLALVRRVIANEELDTELGGNDVG